jgi:hypothetical protein
MKVASTELRKTNLENMFQVSVGVFKQCCAVKNFRHFSTMQLFLNKQLKELCHYIFLFALICCLFL